MRRSGIAGFVAAFVLIVPCGLAAAARPRQPPADETAQPEAAERIVRPVDDDDRVVLHGNRPSRARREFDAGAVPDDQRIDGMVLVLRPDAVQEAALGALLTAQQERSSAAYHQWLTPMLFGTRFGVSGGDLVMIAEWLGRQGLRVDAIAAGRQAVVFSGTAAQVESAFHTTLRRYLVAGEMHFANATDPEIPAALADVVEGVVSLHDFRSQPMHGARVIAPDYTSGVYHYLAPADFATIYNAAPVYAQGIDGLNQSIAIVARSNVDPADLRNFRIAFSLPARDAGVVLPGNNPGIGDADDHANATLAAEWAGAIAPGANVLLVVSGSTGATDGVALSAQYIVDHDLAPILSMGYELCEASLGTGGNSFYQQLWQQAAAEGITVLVSSGDSGAAGCDGPDSTTATHGRAVNGICSPPESTCVGGTELNDTASPSAYWSSSSGASHGSAKSYIPEVAWNESAGTRLTEPSGFSLGTGLWASGGGASGLYAKPDWQDAPGVPADGRRDVPDVAFSAAAHDGYLVWLNGETVVFHGTSLAVPAFAGMIALVEQSAGAGSAGAGAQGNINPTLYALARQTTATVHDASGGNNSVPGVTGYAAGAGYDLVTGLGSMDAQTLIASWSGALSGPALRVRLSQPSIRLVAGRPSGLDVSLNSGSSAAFQSGNGVALELEGLPTGFTSTFTPVSTGVPGSSSLMLSVLRTAPGATYSLHVVATWTDASGNAASQSIPLTLVVQPWPARFRPVPRR
jgi:pseudomonalisin